MRRGRTATDIPARPTIRGSGPQVGRWVWERYSQGLPRGIIDSACEEYKIRTDVYQLCEGVSGMLWRDDDGRFVITTSSRESPQRQVFTAAHELCHFFRDGDLHWFIEDGIEDSVREREANAGAAEMVLPLEEAADLRDRMGDNRFEPPLRAVADERCISTLAVRTRLRVLDELGWVVRPREIAVWHEKGVFIDRSLREKMSEITGVVTGHRSIRRLWGKDHLAPVCASPDGTRGFGTPGGSCATCEAASQCRVYCMVYMIQPGEPFPAAVLLPPNSCEHWREYVQGRDWLGGQVTAFRLVRHDQAHHPWCEVHTESTTPLGVTPLGETPVGGATVDESIIPMDDELVTFRAPNITPRQLLELAEYGDTRGGRELAEELRRRALLMMGA